MHETQERPKSCERLYTELGDPPELGFSIEIPFFEQLDTLRAESDNRELHLNKNPDMSILAASVDRGSPV